MKRSRISTFDIPKNPKKGPGPFFQFFHENWGQSPISFVETVPLRPKSQHSISLKENAWQFCQNPHHYAVEKAHFLERLAR
ncbi:hypothetical protein ES703_49974 [subsurface metagenome]